MRSALIFVGASVLLLGQHARVGQEPLFTVGASSVAVDVAVTRNQRPLAGLRAEDFVLWENGQAQPIRGFTSEELPLDIVLVAPRWIGRLELSLYPEATPPKILNRLRNGTANTLIPMRPEDRVAFITEGVTPRIEAPFTSDRDRVAAVIRTLGETKDDASGATPRRALFAVTAEYAIRMLADVTSGDPSARSNRRRLIVKMTAREWGGLFPDDPIIHRLWEEDIIFTAIGQNYRREELKDPTRREPVDANFRLGNFFQIAQATGGDAILLLDPKDPPDLLTRARQRYRMFFDQPPNLPPGQERKITVELSPDAKKRFPNAVVQAREGYVTR